MKTSEQIDKIAAALVAAQAEMPNVAKTATNPHFKSRYATLDAIVSAARPVLKRHGLAVIQGGSRSENDKLIITTRILHTSGQWIESDLEMTPDKQTPQGIGSALTYARRYGYSMLAIATDDDDDGNGASGKSKKPESKPSPKPNPADDTRDKVLKIVNSYSVNVAMVDNIPHTRNYVNKHIPDLEKELVEAGANDDQIEWAVTRFKKAGEKRVMEINDKLVAPEEKTVEEEF